MPNRTVLIVLISLVLVVQVIIGYAFNYINPTTMAGQRTAGLLVALDSLLFVSVISVYERFFAKTVYIEKEEANE